ncbi:MAG: DEAD/DEAH box helicase, partial [Oscillospiraceae bacterium]
MDFIELSLIPPLIRAVSEAGYKSPSPIQEKAVPPVLAGRDLLGCAQTGTGKTAAFALPILQLLSARKPAGKRAIRALILTPTRELALQIQESFETYGRHLPLRSTVIFGGVGQGPQVAQLQRGIDILVATPGRLNDLIGQGYVHLDAVEIFVLDEADRMLDMGFVQDVKRVLKHLPEKRQTLLFSATMPDEIIQLSNGLLHQPARVFVTPVSSTVESIDQTVYKVDKANKRRLLAHLLRGSDVTSALVFTRTKHGADRVVRELSREGIKAAAIHGNKSQNARQDALARFKAGKVNVLVATDIAARGLDIAELSHVINYDLPNIPETYVHRIGRTGRAGHGGTAISFCSAEELPYLVDIEKLIGFAVPLVEDHPWPMQDTQPTAPAPKAQKQNGRQAAKQPPAKIQPAPSHKK